MGCCVSSNYDKSAPMKSNSSQQSDQEVEETVKEVLSETPTTMPKSRNYTTDNDLKISTFSNDMEVEKHHKDHIFKKPINHPDDLSETGSDNLRVGRGLDPDYAGDVRQMSPAKYRNRSFNGQRNVGSSPARRSNPSPGRVRPGPGRDPRGMRKENGECSGRRSRSPGMRTENGGYGPGLGRSPSVRKTGKSPGKVRSELGDRVRKMEEEKDHGSNGENKWPPPTCENESLENPLVSLECFIFL